MAEVNESSTDCQKERLARSQQDEREKNMQAAMLETEARRRDLDSRLWLLEERRKQVHYRFIVYASAPLNYCALALMSIDLNGSIPELKNSRFLCCNRNLFSPSAQDLNEFTQLRNDYTSLESKYAESEVRLTDAVRQRDAKVHLKTTPIRNNLPLFLKN